MRIADGPKVGRRGCPISDRSPISRPQIRDPAPEIGGREIGDRSGIDRRSIGDLSTSRSRDRVWRRPRAATIRPKPPARTAAAIHRFPTRPPRPAPQTGARRRTRDAAGLGAVGAGARRVPAARSTHPPARPPRQTGGCSARPPVCSVFRAPTYMFRACVLQVGVRSARAGARSAHPPRHTEHAQSLIVHTHTPG